MARWNIQPDGVQDTVTKTAQVASAFQTQHASFVADVNSAGQNCQSAIVAQALANFFTHHKDTLPGIAQRAASSLRGAINATNAYVQGDQQMATQAKQNAASAPVVDVFGGNGSASAGGGNVA